MLKHIPQSTRKPPQLQKYYGKSVSQCVDFLAKCILTKVETTVVQSTVLKKIMSLAGINNSRIIPYHLKGDSQLEHFYHILMTMLGTETRKKSQWSHSVTFLVPRYSYQE